MKQARRLFAFVAAIVMAVALVPAAAFAVVTPNQSHTITINNPDEQAAHVYEAYQIFVGDLNAEEEILSNVDWGTNVDTTKLETAFANTSFAGKTSAAEVAKMLDNQSDDAALAIEFADAISSALKGTPAESTADADSEKFGSPYTITVSGDGYYFIKDKNGTVTAEGEHYTKFMLEVVKDVTAVAKDTHTTSEKKIVEGQNKVDDNNAAIGDEITYEVKLPVPDTSRFNRYWLEMSDKLDDGLTFMGIKSVKIGTKNFPSTNYDLYVNDSDTPGYTAPTSADAAVTAAGGQSIKVVFKDFKAFVENEDNGITPGTDFVVVTYTAVLNDDCTYGVDSNDNSVKFSYSNNPNNTYDGDEITDDTLVGETPGDSVHTFVTAIEILKNDGTNALAGATFTLQGTSFNNVIKKGVKYEQSGYEAKEGETIKKDGETPVKYWKLKDGTYTTTDPATVTNENNVQYDTPEQEYVQVSYEIVEKVPQNNTYTATTGDDGKLIFKGVKEGEYTLTETIAPDGYNLLNDSIIFDIDWSNPEAEDASAALKAAGGFSKGENCTNGVNMDANGANFKMTVVNQKGSTLPSTGGIGTTIFYVVGGLLVAGAAVSLVVRRRTAAE